MTPAIKIRSNDVWQISIWRIRHEILVQIVVHCALREYSKHQKFSLFGWKTKTFPPCEFYVLSCVRLCAIQAIPYYFIIVFIIMTAIISGGRAHFCHQTDAQTGYKCPNKRTNIGPEQLKKKLHIIVIKSVLRMSFIVLGFFFMMPLLLFSLLLSPVVVVVVETWKIAPGGRASCQNNLLPVAANSASEKNAFLWETNRKSYVFATNIQQLFTGSDDIFNRFFCAPALPPLIRSFCQLKIFTTWHSVFSVFVTLTLETSGCFTAYIFQLNFQHYFLANYQPAVRH